MDVTIEPHPLSGTVPAVASKSVAHRLLILAALADGTTDIDCNTTSRDIEATARCLEALGARIARTRRGFRVRPIPRDASGASLAAAGATLDCGESGSTLRFMLPVAAALGRPCVLDGHGRLAERPLSPLYEELASHGARLSQKGVLPLRVEGDLAGGTFDIPGDVSSQYVSGLLMAAPFLPGGVRVRVSEPFESRAYVTITTDALHAFGVGVRVTREEEDGASFEVFEVAPQAVRTPGTVAVEGDWSNAAFLLALGDGVTVTGLRPDSLQGDRVCRDMLHRLESPGAVLDISACPDLGPILFAVAARSCGGVFTGTHRLRIKESDRIAAMAQELSKFGAQIREEEDRVTVLHRPLHPPREVLDGHNDHRIVMALAVLCASLGGTIRGAEAVSKSWPDFFPALEALGLRMDIQP